VDATRERESSAFRPAAFIELRGRGPCTCAAQAPTMLFAPVAHRKHPARPAASRYASELAVSARSRLPVPPAERPLHTVAAGCTPERVRSTRTDSPSAQENTCSSSETKNFLYRRSPAKADGPVASIQFITLDA